MDTDGIPAQHTLRISLHGNKDNISYSGTLLIRNLSSFLPLADADVGADDVDATSGPRVEDPSGASYYVVAVVMVYGFSIVMLIASHIKRKHHKLAEDRQINKYLQEFLVVQEKSSRDSYRHLKKSIIQKLNREKSTTCKQLSKATFPIMAIALPNRNSQTEINEVLQRRKSLAQAYQSIDEENGPSRESKPSSPVHDRSLEPFEGMDPALMDTSYTEGSDFEIGVEVDDDTEETNQPNDSSSTTTISSAVYLPAVTIDGATKPPTDLLQPPKPTNMERRVSWSDERSSESLVQAVNVNRRASCRGLLPTNSLEGECHSIYSRPSSPKILRYSRKKKEENEFGKWMQRCEKRRRSIDPQFDLAAALLRKSLAYNKQKGEKQRQQQKKEKKEKNKQKSKKAASPEASRTSERDPPNNDKTRRNLTKLDTSSASSENEDSSVWLVNELKRPHNGVTREDDRGFFGLHHSMGSRSPLLKDHASPVTPESPHFGARLTPQPLLTPPPAKTRRNPFFNALHGHRSSHDAEAARHSPARGGCPSPQGSPNLRASPYTDDGDDEESLLHITCV
ncbi:hypothetical protein CAPTEDRAFT_205146 [Capitella teleta]|uniref:Uncharacterized protein n=1 Tax=Capitella teleta TaxID=283909 RepID=R7TT62_CAPTE|nr:hypothetical protein CAPTEDRAFT_205146 [Capitella teleta]|eukprot:ELT96814.1 hypothetical protein CAPTEDRAFT_205146 [Capitella teleta]